MIRKILLTILPKSFVDKIRKKIELNRISKHNKLTNEQIEEIINKEYFKKTGRYINFKNPVSYSEKINFSKLYNSSSIKTNLTDKYEVRKWIAKKIGEQYLVPILGCYDSFDKIEFNKLPNQFVIKCNHDSGSTTICDDKSKIDIKELRNKYQHLLKRNWGIRNFEMHYKNILPRIIIEKYMGKNIKDYKFLCFDGKPYYCWVDTNRFADHRRNVYDMDWILQPFNQHTYRNSEEEIKKPSNFDEMKKIATILSQGFDHVRVDLYNIEGKIYFGEMTFSNGNGMEIMNPEKYDYELGKLWKLNINAK